MTTTLLSWEVGAVKCTKSGAYGRTLMKTVVHAPDEQTARALAMVVFAKALPKLKLTTECPYVGDPIK